MVQRTTVVRITDSSGALAGNTIQVFRGCVPVAHVGGMIRLSMKIVRRFRPRLKIKVRRLTKVLFLKRRCRGTLVRTKFRIPYMDGRVVRFLDNAAILWRRVNVLRGARFYGISTRAARVRPVMNRFPLAL